MNKKKNKKCIIIGFGRMGEQYLKCLRSLNFSDIEIIDKSIKRLQIAKKKYNIKDENLSHFLYKKIYKKKYYKFSKKSYEIYNGRKTSGHIY